MEVRSLERDDRFEVSLGDSMLFVSLDDTITEQIPLDAFEEDLETLCLSWKKGSHNLSWSIEFAGSMGFMFKSVTEGGFFSL